MRIPKKHKQNTVSKMVLPIISPTHEITAQIWGGGAIRNMTAKLGAGYKVPYFKW